MAKAKKSAANKPISPEKTNQVYNVKGKNITVYSFPENTILNGAEYIPLLSEKIIKGRCLVIRREDLVPKAYLQQPLLAGNHIFGYTLYDTFLPTYGSVPNSAPRFSLLYNRSYFTESTSWFFCNILEKVGEFFQGIIFTASTLGITNPHLKINLGFTGHIGGNNIPPGTNDSILSVITPLGRFKIDVTPLSGKSFTIILSGQSNPSTLDFMFRRDENDPAAVCEITSFELYDTLLVDPFPILEL